MRILLLILFLTSTLAYAEPQFFLKKLKLQDLPAEIRPKELPPSVHGIYQFLSSGFTPQKKYELYQRNVARNEVLMMNCIANDQGSLMHCKENGLEHIEACYLNLGHFMPGEPTEFILRSKNPSTELAIRVIPNPLTITDEHGRKITMELGDPDRNLYSVRLTNFEPNEEVTINVMGEVAHQTLSDKGTLTSIISHHGDPRQPGPDVYSVTSQGKEPLTLHYEWGPLTQAVR